MAKVAPKYLGDGLYVSFDGFQIAIAVNHHLKCSSVFRL